MKKAKNSSGRSSRGGQAFRQEDSENPSNSGTYFQYDSNLSTSNFEQHQSQATSKNNSSRTMTNVPRYHSSDQDSEGEQQSGKEDEEYEQHKQDEDNDIWQMPIRQRQRFTLGESQELEEVYQHNVRPTSEEKQKLAIKFSTTGNRIQIWFQNRRAKEKKKKSGDQEVIPDTIYQDQHDQDSMSYAPDSAVTVAAAARGQHSNSSNTFDTYGNSLLCSRGSNANHDPHNDIHSMKRRKTLPNNNKSYNQMSESASRRHSSPHHVQYPTPIYTTEQALNQPDNVDNSVHSSYLTFTTGLMPSMPYYFSSLDNHSISQQRVQRHHHYSAFVEPSRVMLRQSKDTTLGLLDRSCPNEMHDSVYEQQQLPSTNVQEKQAKRAMHTAIMNKNNQSNSDVAEFTEEYNLTSTNTLLQKNNEGKRLHFK